MTPESPEAAQAVRRIVGFSALRKLRLLVDGEIAQERANARWALVLGVIFGALFLLFSAGFAIWTLSRVG